MCASIASVQAPGQPWAHRSDITALDAAVLTEDPTVPPVLFSGAQIVRRYVCRVWRGILTSPSLT